MASHFNLFEMSKKLYAKPSIRVVSLSCDGHGFMEASGKYNVTVDGQPTSSNSGALEENPDEIDAKQHHSFWDSWDE